MVSRHEVLQRWRQGGDYASVGRQLGIPAGRAYMIATGIPADGSDSLAPEEQDREGVQLGGTQALLGVPHENPNRPEENPEVLAWVRGRARGDLGPPTPPAGE
ncbi:MAG TPA: hypothetical protein VFN68_17775 [Acidimicrobiales bacterium]|nr:hypothetical protein [Acidimicrobiales bacterium]